MIGDSDLAIPEKMMDLYAAKQKITAQNTANAGVPGYQKLSVSFSAELKAALATGDAEKVRNVQLKVTDHQPGVDTEMEAAGGAKNELYFDTFAQIANYRIRMLRLAVTSK